MNVYSQWFDVLRVGNHYNTMQYFAGTGGDTFEINFSGGYLDKAHVKALADDEGPELTLTFITKSRIKLSRPIMPGSNVLIFRDTPKVVPLAMFSDGAIINSINLDRNAKQAVFVAAEMLDRFDTFGSSLETSVEQVSEALRVAEKALTEAASAKATADDAKEIASDALKVTRSHSNLTDRDLADAHPASSINWAGLGTTAESVASLRSNLGDTSGTSRVTHSDGRALADILRDIASGMSQMSYAQESEDAVAELGSRASPFNRTATVLTTVGAPPAAPANAGYSQGIFVDYLGRKVYSTYDPESNLRPDGVKYIAVHDIKTGALVNSVTVTDTRVGHLDSIHVEGDVAWVTGRPGYPAILKLSLVTGAVVGEVTLDVAHTSQILLAVDTAVPSRFVVWGRFGGDKVIRSGSINTGDPTSATTTQTPIAYPQSEILQGLGYLGNRVYALTGAGGAGVKFLREYNSRTGFEVASIGLNPDSLYQVPAGGVYEPEGFCIRSERLGNAQVVNMYVGWVFGDGTKAGSVTRIFKLDATGYGHVARIQGYAGRQGAASNYQHGTALIKLRFSGTAWEIERNDFVSALTLNTISNLRTSDDGLSITFDLNRPYQDVTGAFCDGSGDFVRNVKAKPVWMYKAGGSSSHLGHEVRFSSFSTGIYLPVNDAPVAVGNRIFLRLDYIE